MNSIDRKWVVERIQHELDRKNEFLIRQIAEVRESLLNDSKSTAGDKHETSRAMVHLELENLGKQLLESERNIAIFRKMSEINTKPTIQSGSLVKTNEYLIFIGLGLGFIRTSNRNILAISVSTPLACLLIGKGKGEEITWNGNKIVIEEIL